MKNYIGISRDHSASMRSIARPAARDYNETIRSIQEAAELENIDTIVSVVSCGNGRLGGVGREVVNSNVRVLQPIAENAYKADAPSTPLYDSVGDLIEQLKAVPDANDPSVAFMVMAITDGEENSSRNWSAAKLRQEIQRLQATDRWTFVFRVPRGYGRALAQRLGVNEGNILEWEQTDRGFAQATATTSQAMRSFYSGRTQGVNSTGKFFANLSDVRPSEVKAALVDVSNEVRIWPVTGSQAVELRPFIESHTRPLPMLRGAAFYQLSKTEKVQDYKQIAIRDKASGKVYSGIAARQMLNLPAYGEIKLTPGNTGGYDVFIQSTSVNRHLIPGTNVLYWEKQGVPYQEGVSARFGAL